jgi:hypothetical protein
MICVIDPTLINWIVNIADSIFNVLLRAVIAAFEAALGL